MAALRTLALRHRCLAALLVVLAFSLKAVVPPGMMLAAADHTLTVMVCADSQHRQTTMTLTIPGGDREDKAGHQPGKSQSVCPFGGLFVPGLAGADPIQLALALIAVMALGFAASPAPRVVHSRRLRPPLRGPPARA